MIRIVVADIIIVVKRQGVSRTYKIRFALVEHRHKYRRILLVAWHFEHTKFFCHHFLQLAVGTDPGINVKVYIKLHAPFVPHVEVFGIFDAVEIKIRLLLVGECEEKLLLASCRSCVENV